MQKNTQLKILVFIFFVIILVLWFYVNGKFDKFSFSMGDDLQSIKNQLSQSISDVKNDPKIAELNKEISIAKDLIRQEISTTTKSASTTELDNSLAQKVLDRINNSSTTLGVNVNYKYDPWKIEFEYPSDMEKVIDTNNQSISLNDEFGTGVIIYHKELKEKTFGEWLTKNFDLNILNKEVIDGLTFWSRNYEESMTQSKAYYVNFGKNIFIISASYKQENSIVAIEKLMTIINSFKITK